MTKRILTLVLALILLLSLCACDTQPAETNNPDAEILAQRRDIAEKYMREMGTFLWRSTEDVSYSIRYDNLTLEEAQKESPDKIITIKAGQIYQGLPYTHAAGDLTTFQDFAAAADDKGVSQISGLRGELLNGNYQFARLSTDCSGAVCLAWNQIGNSFVLDGTKIMTEGNGFLKVGEYKTTDPMENIDTNADCELNGPQTMYEAYSQLQKADAIVRRKDGSGHVMLITGLNVVRNEEGKISGRDSTVTVLHQTNGTMQDFDKYYSEELGEYVFRCFGIDEEFTFSELYTKGYLPITCKELIDASVPAVTDAVTDSLAGTTFTKDTICTGKFSSQMEITSVTVTIADASGKALQEATCYVNRLTELEFDLSRVLTEPVELMNGTLDLEGLEAGTYHCTTTCRTSNGTVHTMRDFDFTV